MHSTLPYDQSINQSSQSVSQAINLFAQNVERKVGK